MEQEYKTPLQVRLACRENRLPKAPYRVLGGYVFVNLVMMDAKYADEFARFCRTNPRPCPLMHTTQPGVTDAPEFGEDIDLRTDLGSYDILRDGAFSERRQDVTDLFDADTVSFLIGSSVSFDLLFAERGLGASFGPVIFPTRVACEPVGRYRGDMVVTMRSYPPDVADRVAEFTAHFPKCHGGPIGRDNPDELGIEMDKPLYGREIRVPEGHSMLFWPCGVTPSIVAQAAKLPLMIVHTPGWAMITDVPTESLYE